MVPDFRHPLSSKSQTFLSQLEIISLRIGVKIRKMWIKFLQKSWNIVFFSGTSLKMTIVFLLVWSLKNWVAENGSLESTRMWFSSEVELKIFPWIYLLLRDTLVLRDKETHPSCITTNPPPQKLKNLSDRAVFFQLSWPEKHPAKISSHWRWLEIPNRSRGGQQSQQHNIYPLEV